jgi:hypothetical protein
MVSPQVRREAVATLMRERSFGVTRACGLIRISRSLYRYRSRRPACVELRERICEIAALKRRYGYRRIHIKLRRERLGGEPQADLSAVSRSRFGGAAAQA